MTRPLITPPLPIPEAADALVAVDRAVAELRRGGIVVVEGQDGAAALVMAAEAATPEGLAHLTAVAGSAPAVAITGRRAAVLNMAPGELPVVVVRAAAPLGVAQVQALTDPLSAGQVDTALTADLAPPGWAAGAVVLMKLSRLLPAALVAATAGVHETLFHVTAQSILDYPAMSAHSLRRITEARVPLVDAENTRIVAFRPADGGSGHLAIIVGQPDTDQPVLARLHSECFTGDLLGSLRCDCGDQLRGAIAELSRAGSGVLLYLAQEGRGIGLINKLRAYGLQDAGFDTLDANQQLGFDDDERIYLPAAEILKLLGIGRVRLLTNNPAKVDGLARHGIEVTERVPHVFPSNGHNEQYLRTKATRGGHLF